MNGQPDGETFSGPSGTLPEKVRSAFLEILRDTLLIIRNNPSISDFCSTLAYHAHNLPGLLRDPSPALLRYYWEIERPDFLHSMEARGRAISIFEKSWQIIQEEYDRLGNLPVPEPYAGND